MHLLRRRRRTGSAGQRRGNIKIWSEPVRQRQAADVRRDVINKITAGGRRRHYRPDLQGARTETRLRLRRLGLGNRLSRGCRGLIARRGGVDELYIGNVRRMIVMSFFARIRLVMILMTLFAVAAIPPTFAQKLGPDGAPNPTASVTPEQSLLKQVPRAVGRIDIPDTKAGV